MIRLTDAAVLAYTKLKVHRVRTGITIGIAGLLFGLMAAAIIVVQGVFTSIASFDEEGLNNRTILGIVDNRIKTDFSIYDNRSSQEFIKEIKAAHKQVVDKKTAAAKKYNVPYDAAVEDPLPIEIDSETKQETIAIGKYDNQLVANAAFKRQMKNFTPFDINAFLKDYSTGKVIQTVSAVAPIDGSFEFMKKNKEDQKDTVDRQRLIGISDENTPQLSVFDESITEPFLSATNFDPTKGEIPVVVPFSAAEKQLGLKKIAGDAPTEEKLARLHEVRDRIGEVSAAFCYRNVASQALLATAVSQQKEKEEYAKKPGYVASALQYKVPADDSCGAVEIASDTRTAQEKRLAGNLIDYQKEIGEYMGEPVQYKIALRGVGISGDGSANMDAAWSVSGVINTLFNSSFGYNTWAIPENLFSQVPKEYRPDVVFKANTDEEILKRNGGMLIGASMYLVEFTDKEEARAVMKLGQSAFDPNTVSPVFATPFGSSTLFIDEIKTGFGKVLLWASLIVGAIAVIILASIIGRTIAEGRRESAVFRAIGAKRGDISAIYSMYTLFLSARIAAFALIAGVVGALVVEFFFWKEATLGAQLAYAASDTAKQFHFFDITSPYLLVVIAVIFIAGFVASILPIALGARRNPIRDMRNDA